MTRERTTPPIRDLQEVIATAEALARELASMRPDMAAGRLTTFLASLQPVVVTVVTSRSD